MNRPCLRRVSDAISTLSKTGYVIAVVLSLASCDDTSPGDSQQFLDRGLTLDSTYSDGSLSDATPQHDAGVPASPKLRVTEFMAKNEGAWVDEVGETDDWIEIENISDDFVNYSHYDIGDEGTRVQLPNILAEPGEIRILWADDELDQGSFHLPFKLSASGDRITLWHRGHRVQDVEYSQLTPNEAMYLGESGEWHRCRWASPMNENPAECGPNREMSRADNDIFEPYVWPNPWPQPPTSHSTN